MLGSSRGLELQPCLKNYGYKSCALDISYGQDRFQSANKRSPLDINSDAGLVPLVAPERQIV